MLYQMPAGLQQLQYVQYLMFPSFADHCLQQIHAIGMFASWPLAIGPRTSVTFIVCLHERGFPNLLYGADTHAYMHLAGSMPDA